ncbi:MAG: hypothetical protein QW255_04830 [Candidatus Bilamarchaeaceae archaeon]
MIWKKLLVISKFLFISTFISFNVLEAQNLSKILLFSEMQVKVNFSIGIFLDNNKKLSDNFYMSVSGSFFSGSSYSIILHKKDKMNRHISFVGHNEPLYLIGNKTSFGVCWSSHALSITNDTHAVATRYYIDPFIHIYYYSLFPRNDKFMSRNINTKHDYYSKDKTSFIQNLFYKHYYMCNTNNKSHTRLYLPHKNDLVTIRLL